MRPWSMTTMRSAARTVRPGRAVFLTEDESPVRFAGEGEVFVAQPGRAA